ncbi:MAG: transcriptional repressor [Proteobacteria bacterium]|jgi:Fur family iron response transcriptional regulator|nr:MAG: transcriptional repressor [Pseudomonadota bacterium]
MHQIKPQPYARALERLRSVGLRPTRQRLALARLLFDRGMERHITAEALHEEVQATGAKVSLATIYNTLHQFTDMGLLREVVVDCGRAYFDTNVGDHHHFFFEDEGRLDDIPASNVRFAEMPAPPEGSAVVGVDVVIRVRRQQK